MKKLLAIFLVLFLASPAYTTTWYSCAGSGNLSTYTNWYTTPNYSLSCTCSSPTGQMSPNWASGHSAGDFFDAGGCISINVDQDPGATGTSSTLRGNPTYGGGFTFTVGALATINANLTAGGAGQNALTVTGGPGSLTINGNITGGTVNGACGLTTTGATGTAFTINGNILAGTGAGAQCRGLWDNTAAGTNSYIINGNITGSANGIGATLYCNGPVTVHGNCTAGATYSGFTLQSTGAGVGYVYGNIVGSDTGATGSGVNAQAANVITVFGNVINGKMGPAYQGTVYLAPVPGNYIMGPLDGSYTTGVMNSHAFVYYFGRWASPFPYGEGGK